MHKHIPQVVLALFLLIVLSASTINFTPETFQEDFVFTQALSIPTPRYPKGGWEINVGTSLFKWSAVAGADSYVMELYRPDNSKLDTWQFDTSLCDATVCQFKLPYHLETEYGEYKWRMQARQGSNTQSAWSDYAIFEYVALDWIEPYAPTGGSTITDTTPQFSWQDSPENVYKYQFELYTIDGTLVIRQFVQKGTACDAGVCSWSPTSPLASGTYKWRVLGKKYPNYTPWTEAKVFTLN